MGIGLQQQQQEQVTRKLLQHHNYMAPARRAVALWPSMAPASVHAARAAAAPLPHPFPKLMKRCRKPCASCGSVAPSMAAWMQARASLCCSGVS